MSELYKNLNTNWTQEEFEMFQENLNKAIQAQRVVTEEEHIGELENKLYDPNYRATIIKRQNQEAMFNEQVSRTEEFARINRHRKGKLKTALKQKAWKSKGHMTIHKYRKTLADVYRCRIRDYYDRGKQKRILCIIGSSGAGKTLASLHLKYKYDANVICSFTTRKPRPKEVNGREHYFVDVVPDQSEMLAYANFSGANYYALTGQVFGPCTVYVVDEKGLIDIQTRWGERYRLFTIYIKRKTKLKKRFGVDDKRIKRDYGRAKIAENDYDWVIENNGTKGEFFTQIEDIYERIVLGQED